VLWLRFLRTCKPTLNPRQAQRHSEKDQASLKCAYQIDSRFLARFDADNLNKLKNLASKIIGEKMKVGAF
jgi:hypothetical protein